MAGTATGGGLSKFDYGRYLAASLAYLLVRQLDAVGLVAFHREIAEYIPAHSGRGHLENILISLEQLRPGGTTDMGIIHVRKRLLDAVRNLRDHDVEPPGSHDAARYRLRAASAVVEREGSWVDATAKTRVARPGVSNDAP